MSYGPGTETLPRRLLPPSSATPNSDTNVNALRPYPGYGNINLRDASDNTNYNSLQVSVSRRLRCGLSFGTSYTFSKSMDTVGGGTPQDSYHPQNNSSLSSIHPAQILTFNDIYTLPFFMKGTNAANRSHGHRADRHQFHTEAFVNQPLMTPGVFGNSGRDILNGPGFQQWDLNLLENFRILKTRNPQFRADSLNVFSHTNFTGLNTTVRFDNNGVATGGFGAITSSVPGRVLSLGLKLIF